MFPENSLGFKRFNIFLNVYLTAKSLNFYLGELDSKNFCFLVFVYDIYSPNKNPIIYSSVNKALKSLGISYSVLLDHIKNKFIYKANLVISFEPLLNFNPKDFNFKPEPDNQLRQNIILFNDNNEFAFEFNSGREMARFFGVDGKIVRSSISRGEYLEFKLIVKAVPFRKTVYVFDLKTRKLVLTFNSLTEALKHAKVNFYRLKNIIEHGIEHKGQIYSYNDKI